MGAGNPMVFGWGPSCPAPAPRARGCVKATSSCAWATSASTASTTGGRRWRARRPAIPCASSSSGTGRTRPSRSPSARSPERARGRTPPMRSGIIGAGAIGSVVGGLLTKADHDITLVDQWPEHVEKMRAQGLKLSGTCGDHLIRVNAIHIHEMQRIAEPFEAAFVAVKSYDTEWATALAIQYLRQPPRVAWVAGRERTLGCVIPIGAGMYEPAHAMRTDNGAIGFKIGELDGADSARARRLAEVMNAVATTKVTTNLLGERWSKLAVNCMANPLAGLSGYGSAEVRSEPRPSRIAIHLAAEGIRGGGAFGYEVEPIYGIAAKRFVDAAEGRGFAEVAADMAASAKFLTGGRPSLLQDVMRGRRTEIEYLNGYVCTEGRRLSVPTPVNDAVGKTVLAYK